MTSYPDFSYVRGDCTGAFTLQANTTYWLYCGAQTGVDGSNKYAWYATSGITYANAHNKLSSDGGSTWGDDSNVASFRILFGGAPKATDITLTVEYTKTYL